ncbi:MAG: RNA polymerase sigma factor, partial [Bacteroidia bacterium]
YNVNEKSDIKNLSDLELIARYKSDGDNKIVGILFERYTHLVFGVCMKYLKDEDEAQDAVMLVFEKLLVDLKKHTVDNFKGWLYMVSKNHCLMHLRGKKSLLEKQKELKKDAPIFMESGNDEHLDNVSTKETTLTKLEECIGKLNEKQRITVDLFFLKEKCYQEVADETGFTMNDVKSFIQNGKRNLKICMESN